ANEGTLFLDEIGDMQIESQAKLLRVLQDGIVERVGSSQPRKVDVRVIAATNQNLKERVQAGVFREDLFYRLNVIQITVPPLRERIEDIPILANHFLKEFAEEYNKPNLVMPAQTIAQLQNFSWPGNVRQLRNVIEGLVVMATGNEIAPAHLPEEIRQIPSLDDSLSIKPGISIAEMKNA
ncbi:MAG TPA: sigma 54-interacting transcriptional regulator, partial [Candidatus Sumerlaeota bacterium]|nr:sigma 54-interacting transcriptional regulator [Candidatus Sumerlaeota bacterium]